MATINLCRFSILCLKSIKIFKRYRYIYWDVQIQIKLDCQIRLVTETFPAKWNGLPFSSRRPTKKWILVLFTIKCLHSFSFAHTQTNNIRPIFVKDKCATVKNWDTKWLVIFIDVLSLKYLSCSSCRMTTTCNVNVA